MPPELTIRLDSCYEVNRVGLELLYSTEIEVSVTNEGGDLVTACYTDVKFVGLKLEERMFDCGNTIGNVVKISSKADSFTVRSIAVLSDTNDSWYCPPTPPPVVGHVINKLYLDPMPPEQVKVAGGEALTIQLGVPMNDFGNDVEIKVPLE